MSNKFDHIEDSVRNAFEGFELPVSDMDWTAISNGLKPAGGAEKGLLVWWNKKGNGKWFVAGLLLLSIAGVSWFSTNNIKTDKTKPVQVSNNTGKENIQGGNTPQQENGPVAADDNSNHGSGEDTHSGNQTQAVSPAENGNSGSVNNANTTGTTTHGGAALKPGDKINNPTPAETPDPKVNTAPVNPVVVNPEPKNDPAAKPVEVVNPPTNSPEPVVSKSLLDLVLKSLKKFGIRTIESVWPNLANKNIEPKVRKIAKSTDPINPPTAGLELYGAVQTNFDRSKATTKDGGNEWNGVNMNSYRNNQVNVRFEAGLDYKVSNWKLGIGAAFETKAFSGNETDTIHVKVPTHILRYTTIQGVDMWFIMKTKDSIIIIRHKPAGQWLEVPIRMQHNFDLKKDWSLTTGLTLNPGYLVGSTGEIANPYRYGNKGFESIYQYGVDPHANTLTSNPSDYMRKFRMGTGLQLGLEKQKGNVNWGVQLQTRYYYTPVWKSSTPLSQNTINYGINFKMGIKF